MIMKGVGVQKRLQQIMCDRRRSLRDVARQIGMFWSSSVYLDQYRGCPRFQLDGSPEC